MFFLSCKSSYSRPCFQNCQPSGPRRPRPDNPHVRRGMADVHQDGEVLRELLSGRDHDDGRCLQTDRQGAYGPGHYARGTPEEDHEQRAGAARADQRQPQRGLPRLVVARGSRLFSKVQKRRRPKNFDKRRWCMIV